MIPPLQKDKLSKTRKSQASDFKRTWELWMPYSPECCSCGIPVQGVQKKSNSVDIKTSENISLGLIPGPSPWAGTNLSWSNHWCCAGPFSEINSRWETAWAEQCLSSKSCFTMQMSPNSSFNLGVSALTEEGNTAWLPSCSPALWITWSAPPARLGPGCYPGYDASDVQVSWRRGIPTPCCSHCSHYSSFPPGGSGCGQELHRQCLMCFIGSATEHSPVEEECHCSLSMLPVT